LTFGIAVEQHSMQATEPLITCDQYIL